MLTYFKKPNDVLAIDGIIRAECRLYGVLTITLS